ncbi:Aldo/keto reductase [Polychaeton citri CBS 116435]|uniref:Aldo/keto reductase n=1 Tax=Polychaeton citri CBS 116435 TaxID=1314669 RepID=A0A9P4PX08_9PEZI|nr:Aldo/keto reductase [Polychaeton citri CBS 116435]
MTKMRNWKIAKHCKFDLLGLHVSNPIFGRSSLNNSRRMPWFRSSQALPLLRVAKALQKYCVSRDEVTILTKRYRVVGCLTTTNNNIVRKTRIPVNQEGETKKLYGHPRPRLDLGCVSILRAHRCGWEIPLEQTTCALNDLVRAGKVRYVGASSRWACDFAVLLQHVPDKHGWTDVTSTQYHYDLLHREQEREMSEFYRIGGMGLIPISASGRLVRPLHGLEDSTIARPRSVAAKIINRVQNVADKTGWSRSHRVVVPVVGISSIERLEDVLAARGRELSPDGEDFLEATSRSRHVEGYY